jgi:hypothetical protein
LSSISPSNLTANLCRLFDRYQQQQQQAAGEQQQSAAILCIKREKKRNISQVASPLNFLNYI